jgi:hypothetical protein
LAGVNRKRQWRKNLAEQKRKGTIFLDVLEMTDTTVISTVITLRSALQHSLEHHAQNPD